MTSPRTLRSGPPEFPGVDRGVGLDHVLRTAVHAAERAAERRHDADGHGVAQVERVADGHDPIARLHLIGITELCLLQGRRRHLGELNQGAIGQRVPSHDLRGVEVLVRVLHVHAVEAHLDLIGVFDDVVVGEDEPGLVDDEARAGSRLHRRVLFARRAATTPALWISIEETLEQVLAPREIGQLAAARARLRADVHDDSGLVLGDVPERGRVDRPAQRGRVRGRNGDGLCR